MIHNTFKKYSLRGFTLIELLVVIAIIGLLSTVIAAPITQARKKGRDGKKVADLHQIVGGLQQYADDNTNNFPNAISGLVPLYIATLPPFAATTTSAKDKYMYSGYQTSSGGDLRMVGFHLGVKLEASNLALGDDRDCNGVGVITAANNFCQDTNADSGNVMTIIPGNLSTTVPVLVGDAAFADDGSGMTAAAGTAAVFQSNDFRGGTDTASTSCTAKLKDVPATLASSGVCIYDLTN